MNVIEKMARTIAPDAWKSDSPIPTRDATITFHQGRQQSISCAQAAYDAMMQHLAETGQVIVPEALVEDLCSELESEVRDRWGYDERLAHKLARDMATVDKARAMFAAAKDQA